MQNDEQGSRQELDGLDDRRVVRIWRREKLNVSQKQEKKSRLWLNDGSYVRLRPEHADHVWPYGFVQG